MSETGQKPMTEKEYREHIFEFVKEVKTKDQLVRLLDRVTNRNHDYGTIIIGMIAVMKGAFNVVGALTTGRYHRVSSWLFNVGMY